MHAHVCVFIWGCLREYGYYYGKSKWCKALKEKPKMIISMLSAAGK
jgi:hypothetical protein